MTLRSLTAHFARWFRLGWIDAPSDAPRKSMPPLATDAVLDAELDRMFGAVPAGASASTGIHQKSENSLLSGKVPSRKAQL
jgi:hypothetical protein